MKQTLSLCHYKHPEIVPLRQNPVAKANSKPYWHTKPKATFKPKPYLAESLLKTRGSAHRHCPSRQGPPNQPRQGPPNQPRQGPPNQRPHTIGHGWALAARPCLQSPLIPTATTQQVKQKVCPSSPKQSLLLMKICQCVALRHFKKLLN